jgi:hypothetical protein
VILSPLLACGKRWLRWGTLALAAILLLALGLRLHKITLQGLWYDELASVMAATGRDGQQFTLPRGQLLRDAPILTDLKTRRPIGAVVGSLARDVHPPLYFLTLRIWMEAVGSSDFSIRLLSVLFSLLAIAGFYDVVRFMHGSKAALAACLIMAVAMPQIRYAQEARMYTMALAWEMLAIGGLIRIERSGASARYLLAFGGGMLGMMFCNYLCAPVCVALGIYAICRLRGRNRKLAIIICASVAAVFLACCLPLMMAQRHDLAQIGFTWEQDSAPGHVGRTWFRAGAIPFRLLQQPLERSEWVAEAGAVLFVIPFLLLRRRPEMLLWGLVLVLPVAFLTGEELIRQTNHLNEIRYLLPSSPAVYAMLATLLIEQRNILLRWALPALAAIGCAIALPVAYEPYKMDLAPVARYLDQRIHDDEPVVFAGGSWGPYFTGYLYAGLARYSHAFPRPIALLDAPASEELVEKLHRYRRVWFFCAGPQPVKDFLPGLNDDGNMYFLSVGYLHVGHWSN